MRAVDTNVLVRALVRDDAEQATRAQALLTEAEVYVPVTVMLELEWVLRSRYGYGPKLVAQVLGKLTALGNVIVGEHQAVVAAAARVAQGWDFADALHHVLSEGYEDFATFDTDLVRRAGRGAKVVPPVRRI